MAEKEGFEPSVQYELYAGFRIRCIRPLCHLSGDCWIQQLHGGPRPFCRAIVCSKRGFYTARRGCCSGLGSHGVRCDNEGPKQR